jgi:EAL domain-containing protein (putative c-di-GMP-specific phosphodiesterase class I)
MYAAKEHGASGIRRFTAEMGTRLHERASLEQDLRRALLLGQFVLHYQPLVDTGSGRIVGIEALLRWDEPERGLIAPGGFIALAEETGLIWEIGRWVLDTACTQAQSWREAGLLESVRLAVNVSPRQFQDTAITDVVRKALDASGLPPDYIALEVTESTAMRDVEHSVRALSLIKEMGVRVSIDDFGTGYSSLSYLKRFPIDTVKIDRSFVTDIGRSRDDEAIVAAIIALAKSLAISTVAEGVETEEQLAFLEKHGCPTYQGFLFSAALPTQEIGDMLARQAEPGTERRPVSRTAVGPGQAPATGLTAGVPLRSR